MIIIGTHGFSRTSHSSNTQQYNSRNQSIRRYTTSYHPAAALRHQRALRPGNCYPFSLLLSCVFICVFMSYFNHLWVALASFLQILHFLCITPRFRLLVQY
jgi:hypothetical protein